MSNYEQHDTTGIGYLAGVLRDEKGSPSAGRVLLYVWSGACLRYVFEHANNPNPLVLHQFEVVLLALVSWVGGARVAEHLRGPLGAATRGLRALALRGVSSAAGVPAPPEAAPRAAVAPKAPPTPGDPREEVA